MRKKDKIMVRKMAEKEEKPKFLKRLVYGFVAGIPAGFILYTLGAIAKGISTILPTNLDAIGFGIGFASSLGIQIGRAIWE